MTEKDRNLIKFAMNLPCTQWGKIDTMIAKAETEEAKSILTDVQKMLLHKEEYLNDLL